MTGALENMGDLQGVELAGLSSLALESGAFSGQQLKNISGETNVFDNMSILRCLITLTCNSVTEYDHHLSKGRIQRT